MNLCSAGLFALSEVGSSRASGLEVQMCSGLMELLQRLLWVGTEHGWNSALGLEYIGRGGGICASSFLGQ